MLIPLFNVYMPPAVMAPLERTLLSGYIGEGPRVQEFEQGLAQWVGSPRVAAVNSGTAAIHLALRLAGVRDGDEVITTPMTCVATNQPILHVGARVVWADVNPATGNMCPEDLQRRITRQTKAIMMLHWGGMPCDLDRIHAIAAEHNIRVIEDACHAFGAQYNGAPIGSHSDFVCFSFQAVKVLTTGDGGALVCRSPADDERARRLRWYGLDRQMERGEAFLQQDLHEPGYKYHMNDVNATIGLEQLRHVAANLAAARENADAYDAAFASLRHVRLLCRDTKGKSSRWLYTLLVRDRTRFMEYMGSHGIAAASVHARNDRYHIFKMSQTHLPGVDVFDEQHVCIPVGWWVTSDDRERIISAILDYENDLETKATAGVTTKPKAGVTAS